MFLIGFMCSGKTTVGRILAERLGWEFLDVDAEIEKREGMSIPEIFEKKGEPYFRDLELRVLRELSGRRRVVISTGGGLGANPEALEFMRERGLVVWLRVSYEEFMERCGGDKSRPLLRLGEERLRKLLKEREKVYSGAHISVEGKKPEEAAQFILERVMLPRSTT